MTIKVTSQVRHAYGCPKLRLPMRAMSALASGAGQQASSLAAPEKVHLNGRAYRTLILSLLTLPDIKISK